jgi:hypothetical protein
MKAYQVSPRSMLRLTNRTIATHATAAFLDNRAMDVGGRVSTQYAVGPGRGTVNRRVEIAVAIFTILTTLSLVVLLLLKVLYL